MNPLPAVDRSGLNHDQQIVAETMLREGYKSFSSSEQDIDCIPDVEIDINLKESKQVQKKHTSSPRSLYPEVKQYIEDLLNQKFVTESKSPYPSPVVCVRKKVGSQGFALIIENSIARPLLTDIQSLEFKKLWIALVKILGSVSFIKERCTIRGL